MNFLAHYYTGQPVDDPYRALGLILPDLARQHHKGLRFRESVIFEASHPVSSQPSLQALHSGVHSHHKADHLFHDSAFFKESTFLLYQALKQYPFKVLIKHLPFFAHISLELLIDRLLIQDYPDMLGQFYNHLTQAEKEPLTMYFESFGHAVHTEGFWRFLQLFVSNRYLQHYSDNEHLAFALSRVYQRATGVDIAPDGPLLEAYLDEAEVLLRENYHAAFIVQL